MFAKFTTLCRSAAAVGLAAVALSPVASVEACGRGGYAGGGYARSSYAVPAYGSVTYPVQVSTAANTQRHSQQMVLRARQLLKAREYAAAHQAISVAVAREPKNSALLQLRSLISFAQGDFQKAAADAYSALSFGRSLDWTAIQQLYPSVPEYTDQYHRLAAVAKEKPEEAHVQFLLAYHHLMLGHKPEGRVALEAAQKKLPQDKLIPMLLAQLPAAPKTEAVPVAIKVETPPATLKVETAPAAVTVAVDDLPPGE
jgi:hypothetical protein